MPSDDLGYFYFATYDFFLGIHCHSANQADGLFSFFRFSAFFVPWLCRFLCFIPVKRKAVGVNLRF